MGRPKASRPTNGNVAGKVLAAVKAEKLWISIVELECRRLGIGKSGDLLVRVNDNGVIDGPDYQGKFSIIPLTNVLRYLEDRHYGRPMDTVNHLHEKPIEHEVTLSLGEGMKQAMERADQRVLKMMEQMKHGSPRK